MNFLQIYLILNGLCIVGVSMYLMVKLMIIGIERLVGKIKNGRQ